MTAAPSPAPAAVPAAGAKARPARCRFCGTELRTTFVDLGLSPLCQTHIESHQLDRMEPFYPLHAWVCHECFLVQLEEYVAPADIFTEYAYFSSYIDALVEQGRRYTEAACARFGISRDSLVIEIASNDGYLLQHFAAAGVPVLGIEPAANVARVAQARGIRTEVCFHGSATAERIVAGYGQADLVIGNNVLAQVPALNDFVAGMKRLMKPGGVATLEFPHLLQLIGRLEFDTIYHEHFSYFSLYTSERILAAHGLALFDVEELPIHGGSLRLYARHAEDASRPDSIRLGALRARERALGVTGLDLYRGFDARVREAKRRLLSFLIGLKDQGKTIAGYGAPGKGNTLLNYCGLRTDFLDYTVDRNPYKQGKFTPGTHIPILSPEHLRETRPDFILILPWNLQQEITAQLAYVREWGGRFIVPIPEPRILE
jgi:SAM-dependent methyltransferase